MQDGPNKRNLRNLTPEQLLKMRNRSTLTAVRRDGTPLPLSFAQERLWFLSRMDGIGAAYHLALGLRLHGHLETQHLQAALDQIIARHEGLRTSICEQDGQLVQCFEPATCGLPLRILQVAPGKDPEAEIIRLAEEESSRAFDLGHGPLARACLIRTTDTHHVLLLVLHHIISDGWSNGLLLKELGAHYSHLVETGHPAPLDAPALAYADYAVWQKQPEQHKNFEKQKAYWKDALAGAPERLLLPTDRRRPAQQSYEGDYLPLQLGEELSAKVRQLARRFGITPYLVLMASYAIVLSRLAGQEDLVIGTPSANRVRKELEEMVGLFVNTLALRFDLSDGLTVDQLLTRMREIFLDSQDNQSLPFEQVVEALRPQRTLSYTPLFQVMFAWQNVEADPTRFAGLDTEPAVLARTASQFDITLELVDNGTCIYGGLEYATSLFDKQTIERLAGYLRQVVRSICELPEQPVHSVPLMDDAARAAVLEISRAVPMPASPIRAIHQLFEECASRHGDRVAIVSGPAELTYDQLNQQANKLAKYLLERGIGREDRIAICMEKSAQAITCLLAVLKAGAAYIPVDASYPSERIRALIEDSDAKLVLTDTPGLRHLEAVVSLSGRVIDVNSETRDWLGYDGTDPDVEIQPDQLAYIIYTSGTTGRPKGVMVEHRALWTVRDAWAELYKFVEPPRILQMASFSFDVFTADIIRALTFGGRLILVGQDQLVDSAALLELMDDQQATFGDFVPAVLDNLVAHLSVTENTARNMQVIVCGSDRWSPKGACDARKAFGPATQIIHAYGLTETAIDCIALDLPEDFGPDQHLPLGSALKNYQVHLMDPTGHLAPIGIIGEICVSGAGLARGYLNQPELTAQRFVTRNIGKQVRIYKTGDLGRMRPGGTIEFLGRNDRQAKLRGFRIELGEVEATLATHPAVTTAICAMKRQGELEQLIAYVVLNEHAKGGDQSFLKEYAAKQLPHFMVPAGILAIETVPLTLNGKLDVQALPECDLSQTAGTNFEPPQSQTEKRLAQIWCKLLGITAVGRFDNFFALGGHSLLAVRLAHLVRDIFSIEIAATSAFIHPTLSALAVEVDKLEPGSLTSITQADRSQDLPLSYAQQRLWFLAEVDGRQSDAYHMPLVLELCGNLNVGALCRTLEQLVERHETLRTRFVRKDGIAYQDIQSAKMWQMDPVAQVPEGETLADYIGSLVGQPFNLETGPLFRAQLVRLDHSRHVLVIVMHHIISDAWSMGVFSQELSTLYKGLAVEQKVSLPLLKIQYSDYAKWQREELECGTWDAQKGYWQTKLKDVPTLLELPTDTPRPKRQSFKGSPVSIELDAPATEKLKNLSSKSQCTLFTSLLGAWALTLSKLANQQDLVIGSPVANRDNAQLGNLIGFFANTLALRVDAGAELTVEAFMSRLNGTVLEAQKHQDLPFEQVIEHINPVRSLAYSPLFQVMFAWEGENNDRFELPELSVSPVPLHHGGSKFDLLLSLQEENGCLKGAIEYASDLFEKARIEKVADYFCHIVDQLTADGTAQLKSLQLLTDNEEALQLEACRQPVAPYPKLVCISKQIEAHAVLSPDAPAVIMGSTELSYNELNTRANQLAHMLKQRGITEQPNIAVCLHRSADMIAALLGILKAGATVVPLDPAYPAARLQAIMEDVQPNLIITEEALGLSLLSKYADITLTTEEVADKRGLFPSSNLGGTPAPDHLAYILYTSGSTGKPKGVMQTHRTLRNLVSWQLQQVPENEAPARVLQFASLNFDVSFQEIFCTLCQGASLVLMSDEQRKDLGNLAGFIKSNGIERAHLPFAVLQQMAGLYEADQLPDGPVCEIVTAGEALLVTHGLKALLKSLGGRRFYNQYGPTETHVVTQHVLECDQMEDWPLSPPIGTPVNNMSVFILDEAKHPVPTGTVGELYVCGDNVARGYFGNPALSAERFVTPWFAWEHNQRFYRTGDLASYLPNGSLAFHGRADDQVKFRGFRIEPMEIASCLLQMEGIQEAAVVLDTSMGTEHTRLVCYFVGAAKVTNMRSYLKVRLPEYMVPTDWVQMDELPITPNGKLDRRALPSPDREGNADFIEPQSERERDLARIWQTVLKVERVGRTDNFFDLGGHSLLATRLIYAINKELSLGLSLSVLIENPVLCDLAAVQSSNAQNERPVEQISADKTNRYEPFPLTDIQQAYWVGRDNGLGLGGVSAHAYEEIEIPNLDLARFNNALNKLIQRHDMLRAIFADNGTQRILETVPEYIIQTDDIGGRAQRVAERVITRNREAMSHQVLDAQEWPLFEFRAVLLNDDVTRLHISMDALIVDAASSQIFSRELAAFYDDPELDLPPLEITFRDYVVQELALREDSRYEASLVYWRDRLTTLAPAPDLPLVKQPESISNPRFTRRKLTLEEPKWSAIKANGRKHGITPSGILLTAFAQVLANWSRSPRFTLSLPIFNRQPLHPHINNLIGDFTSIVLLEVMSDAGKSFVDNSKAVQRQLWKDMDHSEVSGVRVLRELTRQRGEQQTAIPIVFNSTLVEMIPDQEEITLSSAMDARNVHTITQTPQVWLDHTIMEIDGELYFNWDSIDELFPDGMMQEMFAAYSLLLEEISEPDRWNDPARPSFPFWDGTSACEQHWPLMQDLFDEQTRKTLAAPAIISGKQVLSYEIVRKRARNLAVHLQECGLKSGDLVAIKMRPGWEQIVSALAILYAGGAYLPIDPDLPTSRIDGILKHTNAKLVCVKTDQTDKHKGLPDQTFIVDVGCELDGFLGRLLRKSEANAEDLAYVIFTSGSTGEPKGVMIDHRGAVNTLLDINRRLNVGPEDRVFAISALGFDLSVYDIFGLLAVGGAIVVPDESQTKDPAHWLDCMTQQKVTIWNSAPALLGLLADYAESERKNIGTDLRQVMLSGDWIPLGLPDRVRALAHDTKILSLGGATEASIWSICFPIESIAFDWKSIPYGKALDNQQVYVLDDNLGIRPCWVPGELYIGGIGLAMGYWKDEEQTNERFINHPHTKERLYRTGDMGRYMPDGNIEFLGRVDTQVKVQGFRIELGEIETVLNTHGSVKTSVLKMFGEAQGDKQLVGYVVPEGDSVDIDVLLEHLRAHLPYYMVPQNLLEIECIPISANGKVNRKQLPEPRRSIQVKQTFEPCGSQEEKIQEIVARTLKLDQVDSGANLLQLGATSIDIVRISNELSSTLSFRPPLAKFMANPSLATLVAMYREQMGPAENEVQPQGEPSDIATIEDPQERQAFKERNVGLRQFTKQHMVVSLAAPSQKDFDEFDAYRSVRQFIQDPVPKNRFEELLATLRRNQDVDAPKHLFASAGGLYPVQTYIYIKPDRVQGVAGGAYYYCPKEHALFSTGDGQHLSEDAYDYFVNRPTFGEAAFTIYFIAERQAIEPLYGEMSEQFWLIEAGAMAQLLTMRAYDVGLGLCGIGSIDDEVLRNLFQLRSTHQLVYSMIGGTPKVDQSRRHTIENFAANPTSPNIDDEEMEEFEI
ncbi:non-ribosomal peptide synthetase [Pseudovibrio sp. Tun.PSC04-5.I4]|uniref:non-ribosomal peptide synthetase n=1 Tax=Pseudovibrio sp. Tun.PSC04-5.I4 TaxID=1798213 RepID=UPI000884CE35|nr:non-ribosomal peptide synthetase [Pseudovibrio sp. Tun.PSC04-5.I4]SDQ31259.1 amino acid adenylation domain-containing protein [Pseudovibrio sp. Tun.PSC04-5.I4]